MPPQKSRMSNRVEEGRPPVAVVHAIVEFHRLIPVVRAWRRREVIVARRPGRAFIIRRRGIALKVESGPERAAGNIIKVVLGGKRAGRVVLLPQVFHALRAVGGMVLAGHMVGDEVYDDLQPGVMGAVDQVLEFLVPLFRVECQVWIHVIVVFDGIRGTRLSLDDSGMVCRDAIGAVVGLCGMLDDPRIPDVGGSERFDFRQCLFGEICKVPATVFFLCPVGGA